MGFDPTQTNIIKALFLLILAVSGDFISSTLSCKSQIYGSQSILIKHITILCIIYFTLNYTSSDDTDPLESIKIAFYIWIGFLIFTKQTPTCTIITLVLLVGVLLLDNYNIYYDTLIKKETDEVEKAKLMDIADKISTVKRYAIYGMGGTMAVGYITYLSEKRHDFGDNFEWNKFIFGILECAGKKRD